MLDGFQKKFRSHIVLIFKNALNLTIVNMHTPYYVLLFLCILVGTFYQIITTIIIIMVSHECFPLSQAPTLAGVRTRQSRAGKKAAANGPTFTTSQIDREVVT